MKKFGDIFSPFHVINKYDRHRRTVIALCAALYIAVREKNVCKIDALMCDINVAILSLCLSVTFRYCIETA